MTDDQRCAVCHAPLTRGLCPLAEADRPTHLVVAVESIASSLRALARAVERLGRV